jgi:hypothetical protein
MSGLKIPVFSALNHVSNPILHSLHPTQQRLDNQCLELKTSPKCLLPVSSLWKIVKFGHQQSTKPIEMGKF